MATMEINLVTFRKVFCFRKLCEIFCLVRFLPSLKAPPHDIWQEKFSNLEMMNGTEIRVENCAFSPKKNERGGKEQGWTLDPLDM